MQPLWWRLMVAVVLVYMAAMSVAFLTLALAEAGNYASAAFTVLFGPAGIAGVLTWWALEEIDHDRPGRCPVALAPRAASAAGDVVRRRHRAGHGW